MGGGGTWDVDAVKEVDVTGMMMFYGGFMVLYGGFMMMFYGENWELENPRKKWRFLWEIVLVLL